MQTDALQTTGAIRSAVASCCVCSARMLEVADCGEIASRDARVAIISAHKLQAAMCLGCADLADEMQAVLQDVAWHFHGTDHPLGERARAVVAKNAGAKPPGARP